MGHLPTSGRKVATDKNIYRATFSGLACRPTEFPAKSVYLPV
jgi:hypothetical protein